MNGNRILPVANGTAVSKPHSSLTDYPSSRPESLLSGIRKLPDQEGGNLWSPCSNCSSSDENNSPTALNSINWDKPALEDKSVDFGWSSSHDKSNGRASHRTTDRRTKACHDDKRPSGYVNIKSGDTKDLTVCRISASKPSPKRVCQSSQNTENVEKPPLPENSITSDDHLEDTSDVLESDDPHGTSLESNSCPNERTEEDIMKEREDLRNVAWFQAGIPREIALEVLAEKPEGSFIVRESTTKPGCYALSLRVPPGRNSTGIAHYLILHTNRGYKIKGFTKEFTSLSALITHHSVMPELLPCPLSLSRPSTRDAEQEFAETEQKSCDIFSDIHWLMTDLEL